MCATPPMVAEPIGLSNPVAKDRREDLHGENEEIRRYGVPLPQAPTAAKKPFKIAIQVNGEARGRNARLHPLDHGGKKAKGSQKVQDKFPTDCVKSLLEVNLYSTSGRHIPPVVVPH